MTREFVMATTGVVAAWAPGLDASTRAVVASMVVMTIAGMLVPWIEGT